jgi:hypothetical protein
VLAQLELTSLSFDFLPGGEQMQTLQGGGVATEQPVQQLPHRYNTHLAVAMGQGPSLSPLCQQALATLGWIAYGDEAPTKAHSLFCFREQFAHHSPTATPAEVTSATNLFESQYDTHVKVVNWHIMGIVALFLIGLTLYACAAAVFVGTYKYRGGIRMSATKLAAAIVDSCKSTGYSAQQSGVAQPSGVALHAEATSATASLDPVSVEIQNGK